MLETLGMLLILVTVICLIINTLRTIIRLFVEPKWFLNASLALLISGIILLIITGTIGTVLGGPVLSWLPWLVLGMLWGEIDKWAKKRALRLNPQQI